MDSGHWNDLADRFVGSRRWIIAAEVLAPFTQALADFREKGFPTPFVIAGSTGTGPLPDPDHAEIAMIDVRVENSDTPMLEGIRAFDRALRDLPDEVMTRIRAWDPDRSAFVLTSFLDTAFELDGRPTVGARPTAWTALEDKLVVDDLWDAAGVTRAPSLIVQLDPPALQRAHDALDRGSGTVWACDTTEGWHGGGEYLRWVRTATDVDDALAFMRRHGTRVRVMPFLDGVPTSIHGMVFDDHVAAFRPVELLTMRQTGTTRLRYCGTASTWDPPSADREAMRDAARRVGDHLRASVDFRGVFTMDGVLTADGWLPTELNPRFGAGLFTVAVGADLPLVALHRALISREDLDYRPQELERVALEGGDAKRVLRGILAIPSRFDETLETRVRLEDGGVVACDEENAHGTLSVGPAVHGSVVMFRVGTEHTPVGVQAAPIVWSALHLARERWDLPIPDLEPAPDVRRA
jgi:hypothetical protein